MKLDSHTLFQILADGTPATLPGWTYRQIQEAKRELNRVLVSAGDTRQVVNIGRTLGTYVLTSDLDDLIKSLIFHADYVSTRMQSEHDVWQAVRDKTDDPVKLDKLNQMLRVADKYQRVVTELLDMFQE